LEVLRLISEGIQQNEIAEILFLSEGHVSKIKTSLRILVIWLTKKGTLTIHGKRLLEEGNGQVSLLKKFPVSYPIGGRGNLLARMGRVSVQRIL